MATVLLDRIVYAALHSAFADAPTGRPVNKHHVSVDLDAEEIEALQSEQREGETLSQAILRISGEVSRATRQQQQEAA